MLFVRPHYYSIWQLFWMKMELLEMVGDAIGV